ncbi:HepT-like ribonuclease domain-containing protein [Microbacterium sp. A93]|uniref:HepT-like ribonuclease domain-containing protein n=1 Tax=Microbacterium sp. A93 TaxID=3450716 RepID=UPI003F42ED46
MNEVDRIQRCLDELRSAFDTAANLVERGRDAYDSDLAVPLAFEALSNRIGDLVRRLVAADSERFSASIWRQAARHRDYVVHHCDRLDAELLWRTVTESFPELAALVRAEQQTG